MHKEFDIIIVGGGMVGLAAALTLCDTDLSIAVIDAKPADLKFDPKHYDMRVIAVNQSSAQLFRDIGAWESIGAQRISRFDKMFVWADNSKLQFNAAEIDEPELGFIIENNVIRNNLWQLAQQHSSIHLLAPETLESVSIENKVLVKTNDNTYECQLIIGADGANSWLRQHLQFPLETRDYQHHALVTTVQTKLPHQKTAWQRFLKDGPLAFLPLENEHHCSIVWSSAPEKIQQLKSLTETEFNHELGMAFEHRLGDVDCIAPRISFPLMMQHMPDYVSEHVAFIGDAAHRIHPLAGQGANLGFMDASSLSQVIKMALQKKKLYYSETTLKKYQRERKYYNSQMLIFMDFIKTLFSTQSPTLSTLRNLGMETLNQHHWLKQFFCLRALRG